jgi:branched-chain amino acid transport system substrate-binding protein
LRGFLGLGLACVVALGVGACGSDSGDGGGGDSEGASKEPIKIGIAAALTGGISGFDLPPINGLKLAVKDINAAGGVDGRQLEIIESDTQGDINRGTTAAQQVIAKGAEILYVSCDYDFGGPAARVAGAKKMIAVGCPGSTLFGIEGVGPYAFTTGTATQIVGTVMARFAEKRGWKRPYLLNDTSIEYSKGICAGFKRAWQDMGGEFGGEDSFQNSDASIGSQVTRIRSAKPDAVIACTYLPGGPSAIKQIRDAGIDTPIVTTDGLDGEFWLEATPGLSDVYIPVPASIYGDDPEAPVQEFVKKYEAEYGEAPPSGLATLGYAVGEVIKQAVEAAGGSTKGDDLKKAFESTDGGFDVLFGKQVWSSASHIDQRRPMRMMEIQDGKYAYVETIEPEGVKFDAP